MFCVAFLVLWGLDFPVAPRDTAAGESLGFYEITFTFSCHIPNGRLSWIRICSPAGQMRPAGESTNEVNSQGFRFVQSLSLLIPFYDWDRPFNRPSKNVYRCWVLALFTAMARAFLVPMTTTRFLPRVIPV